MNHPASRLFLRYPQFDFYVDCAAANGKMVGILIDFHLAEREVKKIKPGCNRFCTLMAAASAASDIDGCAVVGHDQHCSKQQYKLGDQQRTAQRHI